MNELIDPFEIRRHVPRYAERTADCGAPATRRAVVF